MKSSRTEFNFECFFFITNSVSLFVRGLFRSFLRESVLVVLCALYPHNLLAYCCSWSSLRILFISTVMVVMTPPLFFVLIIWCFSFSWWFQLKVCQFCWSFQRTNFGFNNVFQLTLCSLLQLLLCFYYSFLFVLGSVCSFVSSFLRWTVRWGLLNIGP